MPGMLGNRQDFDGEGELHPELFQSWDYYYAFFTDPLRNAGDPFYKWNNGVNYSSCPEMDCMPPERVIASVQGFTSKTRIMHSTIVKFDGVILDSYKQRCCNGFWDGYNEPCPSLQEYASSYYCSTPLTGKTVDRALAADWRALSSANNVLYSWCIMLTELNKAVGDSYLLQTVENPGEENECYGGIFLDFVTAISHPFFWPKLAFNGETPNSCTTFLVDGGTSGGVYLESYDDLGPNDSTIQGYYQSNNSNNIEYSYPNFFNEGHIYDGSLYSVRNFTWAEIDNDGTLDDVFSAPTNANDFAFYRSYDNNVWLDYTVAPYSVFYDDDHNGVYACYRDNAPGVPAVGLRPELIANIQKTNECLVLCATGVLISGICCPEGSTGIFPPEDARAGRCCIDCSPGSSEVGTAGTPINELSNDAECFVSDKAELIYEVGGREVWITAEPCCLDGGTDEQISGFDFSAGEEIPENDPQPDGFFYGVDYACGPRRASFPEYRNSEGQLVCSECFKWYCDERLGMAKPHLAAYPYEHENTTSELKLNLKPNQWMFIHGTPPIPEDTAYINYLNPGNAQLIIDNLKDFDAIPYSWIVDSVDIVNPGSGYIKDMYFYVDFDVNWLLPFIGGQGIGVFPDEECCDPSCTDRVDISWSDKDGYSKLQGNNSVVYQRLKITEVGPSGTIKKVEVVPWYKSPEYKKPYIDDDTGEQVWSLCEDNTEISNIKDKTPYYIEYFRLLCHPNSVNHPGKDYSIGDPITWDFPEEKDTAKAAIYDTWNNQIASGIVVDVDDNGGILDWYISGSDRWKQYGVFNLVDNTPCYQYANEMQYFTGINDTLERDDRGRYRFLGYKLCDLSYTGKGNTVRACVPWDGVNISTTTELNLKIQRSNCKTTATMFIRGWPFSDKRISIIDAGDFFDGALLEGSIGFYKTHFPPYPECRGGGVEIDIEYGNDLANDSVFGSTVKTATVIASGIGYAFKGKKHVTPILPTGIPGGAVLSYTFDTVDNFPHPDLLSNNSYNFGYSVEADRFSYFPVSNINIENGGSGYEIGQRLDIKPLGGLSFDDPWTKSGGDDPDKNPNGGWYDGIYAKIDSNGHMRYDENASNNAIPFDTGQFVSTYPYLTVEITDIGESGNIQSIDIINRGMMYRTIWTSGIVHPDTTPELRSSLGYGAIAEALINTDINDEDFFGSVIDFWFRGATEAELPDPYFNNSGTIPGNSTMGFGRDYASPDNGYYWMLEDVNIGINGDVHLLAHYDWGINYNGAYSYTPIHYLGEDSEYQTHKRVAGSRPSFVPKSTVCSFTPCYSGLLNKEYVLYRAYHNYALFSTFDCNTTAQPFVGDKVYPTAPPQTSYCTLLRKIRKFNDGTQIELQTKVYTDDCQEESDENCQPLVTVRNDAGGVDVIGTSIDTPYYTDYYVIEYGMTLNLSSNAVTEFRHVNGRTTHSTAYGTNIPNS